MPKAFMVNLPSAEIELPAALSRGFGQLPALTATDLQWATLLKAIQVVPWIPRCAHELVPAWAAKYQNVPTVTIEVATAGIAQGRSAFAKYPDCNHSVKFETPE